MISREPDHFQPLCPTHHEAMVCDPSAHGLAGVPETVEFHDCECVVDECPQHFSPAFGYFTIKRNNDFWVGTNSSSVRIVRSNKQAICGVHRSPMFIASFESSTNLE